MATVDAHRGCIYLHPPMSHGAYAEGVVSPCGGNGVLYKHIGVGFALLVRRYRAMRRPQAVERVTGTNLHAFLCMALIKIFFIHVGIGRLAGK